MRIRRPDASDLPDIQLVLSETELFPPDMLSEMIEPFLTGSVGDERWLVCDTSEGVDGFSYVRREPLTAGTWNLLAIGFRREHQGAGYGARLIAEVERSLVGERILIVDTSSLDQFEATRHFYESCGYVQASVIRDYWADGDDKVTFWKRLSG